MDLRQTWTGFETDLDKLEAYLDRVETSPFRHAGKGGGNDRLGTNLDLSQRPRTGPQEKTWN